MGRGLSTKRIRSMDLLTRLNNHIAMMAPHQRERHGGRLLIEARDEIARQRVVMAFCEGVLSITETTRDFNVEGVKEARKRIKDCGV